MWINIRAWSWNNNEIWWKWVISNSGLKWHKSINHTPRELIKQVTSIRKKLLSKHHAHYLFFVVVDLQVIYWIIFGFYVALASGQLQILKSPKSLSFKGNDRLDSESLADVLAASLGFSVTHPSDWTGLYINDPFSPASGVVAIVVDGVNNFDHVNSAKTHSYELVGSGAQESLDSLVFRVQEHNAEAIDLDLTQGCDVVRRSFRKLLHSFVKSSVQKCVNFIKCYDVVWQVMWMELKKKIILLTFYWLSPKNALRFVVLVTQLMKFGEDEMQKVVDFSWRSFIEYYKWVL